MSKASIDPDAFRAFEVSGWEEKTEPYDAFFQPVTGRIAQPLLDAARVDAGTVTLDLGTGPGYVAAAAASRGARVTGVDVAERMVALAAARLPDIPFQRADSEELPFPDGSFEAVVSNFMLPHLARPDTSMLEAARVLSPGGCVALSTWDVPGESALLGAFVQAVSAVGAAPPPSLPRGPDVFRYADEGEFRALLQDAGFHDVRIERIRFTHEFASIDEVWSGVLNGGVRISALVLGQAPETLAAIRGQYDRLMAGYLLEGKVRLPISVVLGSGRKA